MGAAGCRGAHAYGVGVADELAKAAGELARRLRRWNRKGWDAAAAGGGTRRDALRAAVQRLADLGAVAEGRPPRPVLPPVGDHALPDQLAVMVHDVRQTGDPAAATAAVAELRALQAELGLR